MVDEVKEEYYTVAFNIISNVGAAKSLVMEALYAAKEGEFKEAQEKLEESKQFFREGHKMHKSLIKREANGEQLQFSLILMHAEDQLMSVETISLLVTEIIELYKLSK
ncbi:PTS lactose/cellobiose transporter subunit IIA [Paenibacillus odorifer]|jgi:PTS system cellobiose-specific IIA component|uniref:PTS lactose/cellobiose transporter subunit IIA n=1 Tax=Paenibacillus odorifer TaxID=189426 RepID=A0A1R0Y131_9BACL|nr:MULTISPECIES: PTS lactose/cellobiose transporter subunit IIA [Paenibacillus]ETT65900.1 phosphotransferase system enzyme II, ptcA [Paenibacillus sp. FSL H8-237]MDH6427429.1 PTS system cellobiose-specific IIA component [Paenibacillus sp. PastH-4]MDH6443459.1 PTS system cellobiose-specific IIA component [Paenibacillus sp. PastF-4]MDH6525837.1 PTS system cellobiose-specific IIA component [Paenibacillus sp. PastH-3]OMD21555.1 PTS lactose/cellobiose transporter subunit IIA [Paenibacillus odorifer